MRYDSTPWYITAGTATLRGAGGDVLALGVDRRTAEMIVHCVNAALAPPAGIEDTPEALRLEVDRLRREVGSLARDKVKLRKATSNQQQQIDALLRDKRRLIRERDEFRGGDFSAALADQRAKLVGG